MNPPRFGRRLSRRHLLLKDLRQPLAAFSGGSLLDGCGGCRAFHCRQCVWHLNSGELIDVHVIEYK